MAKPIFLNPFNLNQRRLLQFGIVFLLILFFAILFFILRSTNSGPAKVVLEDSKLQVFNDSYSNFDYPDRISVHYPYLLVVEPAKTITTVYNLEKKEKVAQFKQVLLDYDGKNTLYNGKQTFFNNTSLGVLCQNAFIKSDSQVLCSANINTTASENGVMTIDTKTKLQRIIYETNNLISYISVLDGKMYIGEVDMNTGTSYLVVDGKKIKVPTPVNLIYLMEGHAYLASFKSVFTGNKHIYYLLQGNGFRKGSDEGIVIAK